MSLGPAAAAATHRSDDVHALYGALKHYTADTLRDRRLPPPALTATATSALCGSRVTLDADIRDGVLHELGHEVRACSLGQATTSVLKRRANGLREADVARVRDQLVGLLCNGAGRCDWPELEVFAQAAGIPARHGSALLPFDVLLALFQMAGRSSGASPTTDGP